VGIEQMGIMRGRRCALFVLAVLAAAWFAVAVTTAPAAAIFRAFSPSSPWNQTAVPTASGNPYASQFTDHPGLPLRFSGTPDNPTYGAPVYFAQEGDPTAPVIATQTDWLPDGDTAWDGRPVPVPIGVRAAAGADGHLTVVSSDRRTAWDFLGCTQAGPLGYLAMVIVQWDLTGPGYSRDKETSARGSGAPLISSSLRGEEALGGVQHALGFTVPRVSSQFIAPATHSDGKQGPGALKYGMRCVLRHDYPVPANSTVGMVNVIYALKLYGIYLVDQGADFEMDADFTHAELWQQAGLHSKSLDIQPSDLRPAQLGTPPPIPTIVAPAQQSSRPSTVRLQANRLPIRPGSRLHVYGRVRGGLSGHERVGIEAFTRGAWRYLFGARVRSDGRFGTGTRLKPAAGDSPRTRSRMRLRHLHVAGGRALPLRAAVHGFGRSAVIRVRLAR
jgi:hypothetical protein